MTLPIWTRQLWLDPDNGVVCAKHTRIPAADIADKVGNNIGTPDPWMTTFQVPPFHNLTADAVLACLLWETLGRRQRAKLIPLLAVATADAQETPLEVARRVWPGDWVQVIQKNGVTHLELSLSNQSQIVRVHLRSDGCVDMITAHLCFDLQRPSYYHLVGFRGLEPGLKEARDELARQLVEMILSLKSFGASAEPEFSIRLAKRMKDCGFEPQEK